MEFTSQVSTTKEQSESLLALGLKSETADCIWCEVRTLTKGSPIQWYLLAEHINKHDEKHIPAWSLHRLIEMMPMIYDSEGLSIGWHYMADVWIVRYPKQILIHKEELIDALYDMVVKLKEMA